MSNIYKQLIEKYGEKQVVKAIEELSELEKELCKALIGKADQEHIAEEIADVYIMLEQMMLYFNIDLNKIIKIINLKLERTKERLLK